MTILDVAIRIGEAMGFNPEPSDKRLDHAEENKKNQQVRWTKLQQFYFSKWRG